MAVQMNTAFGNPTTHGDMPATGQRLPKGTTPALNQLSFLLQNTSPPCCLAGFCKRFSTGNGSLSWSPLTTAFEASTTGRRLRLCSRKYFDYQARHLKMTNDSSIHTMMVAKMVSYISPPVQIVRASQSILTHRYSSCYVSGFDEHDFKQHRLIC
jgi:hypothetical protein